MRKPDLVDHLYGVKYIKINDYGESFFYIFHNLTSYVLKRPYIIDLFIADIPVVAVKKLYRYLIIKSQQIISCNRNRL